MKIWASKADHKKLADCVTTGEGDVGDLKPQVSTSTRKLTDIEKRVQVLEQRAEDAENRARRNNIRVIGLPEKVEGNNMVAYLKNWICTEVAEEGLSPYFALERADRVPAWALPPGRPPRSVVARLLFFKDRDHVLSQARLKGQLKIENSTVRIFPDFSSEVQRQ